MSLLYGNANNMTDFTAFKHNRNETSIIIKPVQNITTEHK